MKRKLPSITSKLWSVSAILAILILWQLSVSLGLVEGFMLPSPVQVAGARGGEAVTVPSEASPFTSIYY